jgi:putative acetyltransferase
VIICPETPEHYAAIRALHVAAFDSPLEATLVERLREDGLVIASLLAVDDTRRVLGHILFSPVTIVTGTGDQMQVASLAPMSVLPSHQRRGIGSVLVERGIQACRQAHSRAVVVVGHMNYYPRFGFSHALVSRLANPFAAGEAFMGLELDRGALSDMDGTVVYPKAFKVFC